MRLELILHLAPELQIERAQRLIEQQDRGIDDERPRERHALALAARQLMRLAVDHGFETDQAQRLSSRGRAAPRFATPRMRRPKPTLPPTVMCGKSA